MFGNVGSARGLLLLAGLVGSPLCCVAEPALWAQLAFQVSQRHVVRVPGLQDEIDCDVLGLIPLPCAQFRVAGSSATSTACSCCPRALLRTVPTYCAQLKQSGNSIMLFILDDPHCLTTLP